MSRPRCRPRSPTGRRPRGPSPPGSFGVHVTAVAPGFFRTDFLDPTSVKYTDNAIADYPEPMRAFLDVYSDRNQTQAGDLVKLGELLVGLTELDDAPSALVAGSDAVDWALTVATDQQTQVEKWLHLSVSTDGTRTD